MIIHTGSGLHDCIVQGKIMQWNGPDPHVIPTWFHTTTPDHTKSKSDPRPFPHPFPHPFPRPFPSPFPHPFPYPFPHPFTHPFLHPFPRPFPHQVHVCSTPDTHPRTTQKNTRFTPRPHIIHTPVPHLNHAWFIMIHTVHIHPAPIQHPSNTHPTPIQHPFNIDILSDYQ